jgi:general secretion pathway protein B
LWQNHLFTVPSSEDWDEPKAAELKAGAEYQGSALRIEVLVWAAERAKRMVYLNGRRYVEGEKLDDGTVVEQIARDGVILVHQGKRVRLRAEAK